MFVTKRNGKKEKMDFDKIKKRLTKLGTNLNVDFDGLTRKVMDQIYNEIETSKIDELCAEQCATIITTHYDYGTLAAAIVISNHHKNTSDDFTKIVSELYHYKDIHNKKCPIVSELLYNVSNKYADQFEILLDYQKDYLFNYFGFKTLEKKYLLKINNKVVERPQHMWLRVAIQIHQYNIDKIKESYIGMSNLYFTHATPTLYNSCTLKPQLSSCFLLAMEEDSIYGIYKTLLDCALISKGAGGIGFHIHNIRGSGSYINGTNGISNGIVPMLRVFNNTARYVDQGGGKRNGSFAVYVEPWHVDIEDFLQMKKNHGDEDKKARDLFYALWIPDLFMKRVKQNANWTLMCPNECPGLSEVYGDEFETLYEKYEKDNYGRETLKARDIWFKILDSQIETGTPYMLYKDACNKKSNQKNLGTIKSSNLCTEIIEYSNNKESAVCNLASIGLSQYVKEDKTFDYKLLHNYSKIITENLNNIIDINYYPTKKTKRSNLLHRPIGIGVQGLADVFALMDIPYESEEAKEINRNIFETIYHGALERSFELAKERNEHIKLLKEVYYNLKITDTSEFYWKFKSTNPDENEYEFINDNKCNELDELLLKYRPVYNEIHKLDNDCNGAYSSFKGSPMNKGFFQFDLWNVKPSDRYDWETLRENIKIYGARNSLLLAPMPTASTSQILGNNECFEPFTSNIYVRRTNVGEFIMINKYLIKELIENKIWNKEIKNSIIYYNGSIQHLDVSEHIKNKYKTAWEISMKHLIDMSKDRGAFICQSQSLNLWMEDPNYGSLTAMHFYAWTSGLKTGLYYLRTRAKAKPQQFTIEPEIKNIEVQEPACEMCSS